MQTAVVSAARKGSASREPQLRHRRSSPACRHPPRKSCPKLEALRINFVHTYSSTHASLASRVHRRARRAPTCSSGRTRLQVSQAREASTHYDGDSRIEFHETRDKGPKKKLELQVDTFSAGSCKENLVTTDDEGMDCLDTDDPPDWPAYLDSRKRRRFIVGRIRRM